MISVRIRAYELEVEVQHSESHPDALTDVANRAITAFQMAVSTLQASEIALFNADMLPDSEELE
jgi:hypothetical protein